MTEITLAEIETTTKAYAERRDRLYERLTALEKDLNAVKQRHLKEIKRCTALAAETEAHLRAAIDAAPDLFEKPKTQIFHGIKVGLRKGKGSLDWEDDAALVARIKKLFPDHVTELVLVTEKPSKTGLNELDTSDLRKLGVTVEETGEQVVIKPIETAIEKLVKALLKDAREQGEEAA